MLARQGQAQVDLPPAHSDAAAAGLVREPGARFLRLERGPPKTHVLGWLPVDRDERQLRQPLPLPAWVRLTAPRR